MPRKSVSHAGKVVNYFRTAELAEAKVAFELVGDVMRERLAPATKPKVVKKVVNKKVATQPQVAEGVANG